MSKNVNSIFISYSHKDKIWLERLQVHLVPYATIRSWDDTQIPTGADWLPHIENALESSQVVVFLVSPHFLASRFIKDHERDPVFKRTHEIGNVKMFPVLLKACGFRETYLGDIQFFLPDNTGILKPLADFPPNRRDRAFVKLCDEIKQI